MRILRILFSSFLNLIMKMTIVFIVLDVYKYDPEEVITNCVRINFSKIRLT